MTDSDYYKIRDGIINLLRDCYHKKSCGIDILSINAYIRDYPLTYCNILIRYGYMRQSGSIYFITKEGIDFFNTNNTTTIEGVDLMERIILSIKKAIDSESAHS